MHLSPANSNRMAHKIVISPATHLDEYEAYEWYEKQCAGLGEELLKELETLPTTKLSNTLNTSASSTKEKNSGIISFQGFHF